MAADWNLRDTAATHTERNFDAVLKSIDRGGRGKLNCRRTSGGSYRVGFTGLPSHRGEERVDLFKWYRRAGAINSEQKQKKERYINIVFA